MDRVTATPLRKPVVREYRCAHEKCNRKLQAERWIYSSWTKARYCWPGDKCQGRSW